MKPLVFIMFPKKLFSNSKLTCSHISFFVLGGVCPGAKFKNIFILLYAYSDVPLPLHHTRDLSQTLLRSSVCHVYLMAYLAPEPQLPRAVTTAEAGEQEVAELASCNPATWVDGNCLTALPVQWAASCAPACTPVSTLIAPHSVWEEQLTWICLHMLLLWITILTSWGKRQCPRLIWWVLITQAQYFYPSCTEHESHITGTHFLPLSQPSYTELPSGFIH